MDELIETTEQPYFAPLSEEEAQDPEFLEAIAILSDPNGLTHEVAEQKLRQLKHRLPEIRDQKLIRAALLKREQNRVRQWHRYWAGPIAQLLSASLAVINEGKKKPEKSFFLGSATFKMTQTGGRLSVINEAEAIAYCEATGLTNFIKTEKSLKTADFLAFAKENGLTIEGVVQETQKQNHPAISFEGLPLYKFDADIGTYDPEPTEDVD